MDKKIKDKAIQLPFYDYEGNAHHVLQLITDEVQKLEDSGYLDVEMWFNSRFSEIILKGYTLETDEECAKRSPEEEAANRAEKEAEEKKEREEYLRLKAKFEPNV